MNKFRKVFLTHTGIGLKGFRLIHNTVYGNRHAKDFYKYAVYKFFTAKRVYLDKDVEHISIHNHWSGGYHHWVVESLVKALTVDEDKRSELTIVLPEGYHQFAYDSIRPLNFKSVVQIPDRRCISVNQVVLPKNPDYKVFLKKDISKLRSFYYRAYNVDPDSIPFRKIYVSRANANLRKITNEYDVIEVMKAFGFEIVLAEEYTFEQQVKLFAEAKFFVSIHGAALTNMVFMKEGTKVVEFFRTLIDSDPPKTYCFDHLASASNVSFSTLYYPRDLEAVVYPDRADITVDIANLRDWLSTNMIAE